MNTELKCLFNSSAITNPSVIIFPALSSSGPTLSRTFCLLFTYAYKLLLSHFICCANLYSKFRLDFLTLFVAAFSAKLCHSRSQARVEKIGGLGVRSATRPCKKTTPLQKRREEVAIPVHNGEEETVRRHMMSE